MRALVFAFAVFLSLAATSANAGEYWRHKWFDFPDPGTLPRSITECVDWAVFHAPCPTTTDWGRMCEKRECKGHATRVEMLRIGVVFIASGPDSPDEAVHRAVTGYVAGCGAAAIGAANMAAGTASAGGPAASAGAGATAAVGTFKTCLLSISVSGIIGGVLNQISLRVENPTHWARL